MSPERGTKKELSRYETQVKCGRSKNNTAADQKEKADNNFLIKACEPCV